MEITDDCSRPSTEGPAEYFTGDVRFDPLFDPRGEARAHGVDVTFEPGARSAWHTHPVGQNLVVTRGCELVQREGGPIEEIRAGDVVWIPAGEKHWHGAKSDRAMTHVAIHEELDGEYATWMEHVTDEEYEGDD
ncbi:MAG: cupin domain-containing protein [Salinigranum sp.]